MTSHRRQSLHHTSDACYQSLIPVIAIDFFILYVIRNSRTIGKAFSLTCNKRWMKFAALNVTNTVLYSSYKSIAYLTSDSNNSTSVSDRKNKVLFHHCLDNQILHVSKVREDLPSSTLSLLQDLSFHVVFVFVGLHVCRRVEHTYVYTPRYHQRHSAYESSHPG